jgi:hypothetical protein
MLSDRRWGYGWESRTISINDTSQIEYISHGALANGYWGLLTKLDEYTIVILSNFRPADISLNNIRPIPIRYINENIIRILKSYETEEYKKSLAKKIAANIKNKSLNEIIANESQSPDDYAYNDGEFVVLGYELLEQNENDKALGVFDHMLGQSTDKALAHECLGDAYYYYIKDNLKARNHYQLSFQYNNSNDYVKKMINKLLK